MYGAVKPMERNLALADCDLETDGGDRIAPDPALLIRALRQIGYSFEQAIADLVDNSISAGARNVLLRFELDAGSIRRLFLVDDGSGMSFNRLKEAMRFGSEPDAGVRTLGKFGMGLKLASLSHCRSLSVLTRSARRASGRRWTVAGIERGWECDVLRADDVARSMDAAWAGLDVSRGGTVIIWEEIDKLPTGTRGLRETLRSLQKRLQLQLGLCFHRFIEKGRVRIILDQQTGGTEQQPHVVPIAALNPFGYAQSGSREYPKRFKVELGPQRRVTAEAHIWPANSESPQYKLGNKAAARQGFYFYRNDRLIQAGGWNGLVQHDSEPHGSLARVRVDVPESFDSEFGLNVQKSSVITPSSFIPGLLQATAADGTSFDEFRRAAQNTYRKKDARAARSLPMVPGRGFPKSIASEVRRLHVKGPSGMRPMDFIWGDVSDPDALFEIERGTSLVRLNRLHRKLFNRATPSTGTESVALKLCLFLLLNEEFGRSRVSEGASQRLAQINSLLLSALRTAKRVG